jgi:hypothetical protein
LQSYSDWTELVAELFDRPREMTIKFVDREALEAALERFAAAESLFRPERVCLATTDGAVPDLRGRDGFIVHWKGSSLPWFLGFLRAVVTAERCLVEPTESRRILTFAREADECGAEFYSFSRTLLPSVVDHMRKVGWHSRGVAEIADQDSSYAELVFCCNRDDHEQWLLLPRHNRDCPRDIASVLEAF